MSIRRKTRAMEKEQSGKSRVKRGRPPGNGYWSKVVALAKLGYQPAIELLIEDAEHRIAMRAEVYKRRVETYGTKKRKGNE